MCVKREETKHTDAYDLTECVRASHLVCRSLHVRLPLLMHTHHNCAHARELDALMRPPPSPVCLFEKHARAALLTPTRTQGRGEVSCITAKYPCFGGRRECVPG